MEDVGADSAVPNHAGPDSPMEGNEQNAGDVDDLKNLNGESTNSDPHTEEPGNSDAAAPADPTSVADNTLKRNRFFTLGNERGKPVNRALRGRTGQGRQELVRNRGGTKGSEEAVLRALRWLAEHQDPDGSWNFDHAGGTCDGRCNNPGNLKFAQNGATGMALLPFLGAGHTHMNGEFQSTVSKGLLYLVNSMQQTPKGSVLVDDGNMYSHGLAAITISEAYAMTQDGQLEEPAQQVLNYIMHAQDPSGGGWRYAARQRGDTSMVGWQIMALKSGSMAYLKIDPAVIRKAEEFLDSVQMDGGASYGYTGPGRRPATSAIGLLSRMYIGWSPSHPAVKRGAKQIAVWGPLPDNMYYNYYAAQVMFQHTRGKGAMWRKWNADMRTWLVDSQIKTGHETGSWFMATGHAGSGGRLYCTSLATMILEVYYRHMPILLESATASGFPD